MISVFSYRSVLARVSAPNAFFGESFPVFETNSSEMLFAPTFDPAMVIGRFRTPSPPSFRIIRIPLFSAFRNPSESKADRYCDVSISPAKEAGSFIRATIIEPTGTASKEASRAVLWSGVQENRTVIQDKAATAAQNRKGRFFSMPITSFYNCFVSTKVRKSAWARKVRVSRFRRTP